MTMIIAYYFYYIIYIMIYHGTCYNCRSLNIVVYHGIWWLIWLYNGVLTSLGWEKNIQLGKRENMGKPHRYDQNEDENPSNEKKGHKWLFVGYFSGMKYYPVVWGLFHKPWHKDPVLKQPGFNGKSPAGLFDRGSNETRCISNLRWFLQAPGVFFQLFVLDGGSGEFEIPMASIPGGNTVFPLKNIGVRVQLSHKKNKKNNNMFHEFRPGLEKLISNESQWIWNT